MTSKINIMQFVICLIWRGLEFEYFYNGTYKVFVKMIVKELFDHEIVDSWS